MQRHIATPLVLGLVVGLVLARPPLTIARGKTRVVAVTNASLFGATIASIAARPDSLCTPLQWAPLLDVTTIDCRNASQPAPAPSKCFNVSGREALNGTVRVACLQQTSVNVEGFLRVRIIDTPPKCENFTMGFNPEKWTSSTYMEFHLRGYDAEGPVLYMLSNKSVSALGGTLFYCADGVSCERVDVAEWGRSYSGLFRYHPPRLTVGASERLPYRAVDMSMNGCVGAVTFRAAHLPSAALRPMPPRTLYVLRGALVGASLVDPLGSPSVRFSVFPQKDPTCLRICTPPSYAMRQIVDTGSTSSTEDVDLYCSRNRAITGTKPRDVSQFTFRHRAAYVLAVALRPCTGSVVFAADNSNGIRRYTSMNFSSYLFQCRAEEVTRGQVVSVGHIVSLTGPHPGAPLPNPSMRFVLGNIFVQNASYTFDRSFKLQVRNDAVSGMVTFMGDELPSLACYVTVASTQGSGMTPPPANSPLSAALVKLTLGAMVLAGIVYLVRSHMVNRRRGRMAIATEEDDDAPPPPRMLRQDPFRSNSPPAVVSKEA